MRHPGPGDGTTARTVSAGFSLCLCAINDASRLGTATGTEVTMEVAVVEVTNVVV